LRWSYTEEEVVNQLAALTTIAFLVASSAWAQTTAPAPGGAGAASGSGISDYWWLILIVAVAALAMWYFLRRNRSGV
jgi:LPXTG-motif cell wall-anchored protein